MFKFDKAVAQQFLSLCWCVHNRPGNRARAKGLLVDFEEAEKDGTRAKNRSRRKKIFPWGCKVPVKMFPISVRNDILNRNP